MTTTKVYELSSHNKEALQINHLSEHGTGFVKQSLLVRLDGLLDKLRQYVETLLAAAAQQYRLWLSNTYQEGVLIHLKVC